jgi:4-amino-4-deoxy-L-arabinose transferase-like glycosyltransferase
MIDRIREHLNKYKRLYILGSILFLSLVIRVWHSTQDSSVWWDGAIYIGMGKYIATGGTVGLWEMFRPPLFPLFYSLLYTLHIPLVFVGKAVVILASVGSVWIAYILAESIRKGSGFFASIFLSITPVFFTFSKIPITDIISVFFIMLALLLYKKNKYLLVGFLVGVAFLLRFPQGLMLVSLGIIIICDTYNSQIYIWIRNLLGKGILLGVGFAILAVPYFISNNMLYGGAFKPLIQGNIVIGGFSYLYDLGTWYYATELLKTAPFLGFAIFAPLLLLKRSSKLSPESKLHLRAILITALVYCVYFFWQSHKELRYSIAFIPYIAILSGVAFTTFFSYVFKRKIFVLAMFALLLVFLYQSFPYILKGKQTDVYAQANEYLKTLGDGDYVSTTPVPVVFSNVRIVEFFGSISDFTDVIQRRGDVIDGVVLNMCDLNCTTESNAGKSCLSSIEDVIAKTSFVKSYEADINHCPYIVFNK